MDEQIDVTIKMIKENHKGILSLLYFFIGIEKFDNYEQEDTARETLR